MAPVAVPASVKIDRLALWIASKMAEGATDFSCAKKVNGGSTTGAYHASAENRDAKALASDIFNALKADSDLCGGKVIYTVFAYVDGQEQPIGQVPLSFDTGLPAQEPQNRDENASHRLVSELTGGYVKLFDMAMKMNGSLASQNDKLAEKVIAQAEITEKSLSQENERAIQRAKAESHSRMAETSFGVILQVVTTFGIAAGAERLGIPQKTLQGILASMGGVKIPTAAAPPVDSAPGAAPAPAAHAKMGIIAEVLAGIPEAALAKAVLSMSDDSQTELLSYVPKDKIGPLMQAMSNAVPN